MKFVSNYGNEYIGIYGVANNSYAILPYSASPKLKEAVKEELKVEILPLLGYEIPGLLSAMNNNGIVIAKPFDEEWIKPIREKEMEIVFLEGGKNAAGNLLAINDKICVHSGILKREKLKEIEDKLNVECIEIEKIAGYRTIGSVMLLSNKGAVVHYRADVDAIKEILGIPVERATVLNGTGFLRLGVIWNEKGLVFGEATTAFEADEVRIGLFG